MLRSVYLPTNFRRPSVLKVLSGFEPGGQPARCRFVGLCVGQDAVVDFPLAYIAP